MRVIINCVVRPRHRAPGPKGCAVCVEALLEAVAAYPTPRAAAERFAEAVQLAVEETLRRQRWWTAQDPTETARQLIFLQAARELAIAKTFLQGRRPEEYFPSHAAYLDFRAGEFGLPGYVFASDYYEMIALLSGFPLSLLVRPPLGLDDAEEPPPGIS